MTGLLWLLGWSRFPTAESAKLRRGLLLLGGLTLPQCLERGVGTGEVHH